MPPLVNYFQVRDIPVYPKYTKKKLLEISAFLLLFAFLVKEEKRRYDDNVSVLRQQRQLYLCIYIYILQSDLQTLLKLDNKNTKQGPCFFS